MTFRNPRPNSADGIIGELCVPEFVAAGRNAGPTGVEPGHIGVALESEP
ncbi:MAG: hypothetical protein ACLPZM_08255 [Thermoplasmata archaeon]